MKNSARHQDATSQDEDPADIVHAEAIVIGAGVSGIYQLHRLVEANIETLLVDAAPGVGGTWYWNRYPGARLDSESYSYGYFFSPQLWQKWAWSEEFVAQPELERYLNFAVDELGLRERIQHRVSITTARWSDRDRLWTLTDTNDRRYQCRYVIAATGLLSAPVYPASLEGLDTFEGEWHHTARWPEAGVEMAGRDVAIIGTGSSGVQLVSSIASDVRSLVVFQRSANWCTPLNNRPISEERAADIRKRNRELRELCAKTPSGFIHSPRPEAGTDVDPLERDRYLQQLWDEPGLTMYTRNFRDLLTSRVTNDAVTAFLTAKIRARVHCSELWDDLIPNHGYGMKRPVLENGYYEAYNQHNVDLVNLAKEPIVAYRAAGIETSRRLFPVDLIVFATGFDAATGALSRIDIRGRGEQLLREKWAHGPRTYIGTVVDGFPNLFIVGGPQGPIGNNPRATEIQVDWIADCLTMMAARNMTFIEARPESVESWVDNVNESISGTLLEKAESWAFGSNVAGKARAYQLYGAGLPTFREKCHEAAADGYQNFIVA